MRNKNYNNSWNVFGNDNTMNSMHEIAVLLLLTWVVICFITTYWSLIVTFLCCAAAAYLIWTFRQEIIAVIS